MPESELRALAKSIALRLKDRPNVDRLVQIFSDLRRAYPAMIFSDECPNGLKIGDQVEVVHPATPHQLSYVVVTGTLIVRIENPFEPRLETAQGIVLKNEKIHRASWTHLRVKP